MSNDPPSNPDDRDNNTTLKSEASSMLDSKIAKLSLPDNVTMIIVKNANTMQQFFAQLLQKQLALNKISAQDHEGAHLIVKSAKVDKSKHCPITAPKRFQDDKEMKAIQEEDDKLLANLEKTKSSLIRRSASRTLELMKEEFRKLQLTSIRELAIELANTERVRSELLEFKNVPTDVTDVQLGDAAAIEYIATNVREEDAAKYLFKSAKALTTAYAELHNVPMPKEDNPITMGFQVFSYLQVPYTYFFSISRISECFDMVWCRFTRNIIFRIRDRVLPSMEGQWHAR